MEETPCSLSRYILAVVMYWVAGDNPVQRASRKDSAERMKKERTAKRWSFSSPCLQNFFLLVAYAVSPTPTFCSKGSRSPMGTGRDFRNVWQAEELSTQTPRFMPESVAELEARIIVGALHGLGDPGGASGQGLAARTHPTTPARSRAAREPWGSPSPGHRAPPWGQGWAEARLGRRPAGLGRAGDQHRCGAAGNWDWRLWGGKMGSWALGRWGEVSGRLGRDSQCRWCPQGRHSYVAPYHLQVTIFHFTSLALPIKSCFCSTSFSSFLLPLSCYLLNYAQFLVPVLLSPLTLLPSFFIFIQSSCPCLWFLHSPLPPQVPTNDARETPHRIWEIELGALTIHAHLLWWSSVFFDPLNIFHWLYRWTWLTTLILLSKSWLFSIQSSLTNYPRHSNSSVSFSGEAWLSQAMYTSASSRDQTEMELRIEVFNTYAVCASLFQTRSNLGSEESPGRVGNLSSKEAQTIPFTHYNGSCHIQTLCLHCKGEKKLETLTVLQLWKKKAPHSWVLPFIWVLRSLKFLLNPGSKREQKTLPFPP